MILDKVFAIVVAVCLLLVTYIVNRLDKRVRFLEDVFENEHEKVEPYKGADGRMKVKDVDEDGNEIELDVAKMVAISFPDIVYGEPKDDDSLPLFKDGDPENCEAENLYWE